MARSVASFWTSTVTGLGSSPFVRRRAAHPPLSCRTSPSSGGRCRRAKGSATDRYAPGLFFFVLAALTAASVPIAAAADRTPQSNYLLRCSGCHRATGEGQESAGIPPFQNSVGAFAGTPRGRLYLLHVPGIAASSLSDAETAAVLNHVMARFAGTSLPRDAASFDAAEVARLRAVEVKDVVALRRELVAEFYARGIVVAGYPWP